MVCGVLGQELYLQDMIPTPLLKLGSLFLCCCITAQRELMHPAHSAWPIYWLTDHEAREWLGGKT